MKGGHDTLHLEVEQVTEHHSISSGFLSRLLQQGEVVWESSSGEGFLKGGHDTLQVEDEQVTEHYSIALGLPSVVPVSVHGRVSGSTVLQNISSYMVSQVYVADNDSSGDELPLVNTSTAFALSPLEYKPTLDFIWPITAREHWEDELWFWPYMIK